MIKHNANEREHVCRRGRNKNIWMVAEMRLQDRACMQGSSKQMWYNIGREYMKTWGLGKKT